MDGIAVLVDSRTGNTKKIATAIADELGVGLSDISVPVPADTRLLLLGSGTYSNSEPGGDLMRLIRNGNFSGFRIALFGTSTYEVDGKKMIGIMADALESKGASIVSVHGSRGRLFVLRNGRTHQDDLDGAKAFAREMTTSG
jgi:flavodoxin